MQHQAHLVAGRHFKPAPQRCASHLAQRQPSQVCRVRAPQLCSFASFSQAAPVRSGLQLWRGARPAPPPRAHASDQELAALGLSEEERARVASRCGGEGQLDLDALRENVRWMGSQAALKVQPRALLVRAPRLMCSPGQQLQLWADFFSSYGFSEEQFRHILTTAPDALEKATLLSAGISMAHLKQMGLDEYAIIQLVSFYPEVLFMDEQDTRELVEIMVTRHQSTHGC